MKKKLSMLVIAALMATTICGCSGGGQTDSKQAETQATEKAETQASSGAAESEESTAGAESDIDYSGTITMFCGTEDSKAFDAVMAEYQKIHPDVNIEYIIWENVTDFETMMTNYIATNTLPDMYRGQIGVVQQQYAMEGYLLPLDDLHRQKQQRPPAQEHGCL